MTQVPGNGGPRPKYITPEGERALRDELQYLWKVKRPEVTQAVREAAALGDRSENAEYIYGKKKLREIDRRLRYLSNLIENLTVIEPSSNAKSTIDFGCTVDVEDEDGKKKTYQLVGEDEVDAKQGQISMKSPVGRA